LYIVSDAAFTSADKAKINEVRAYISQIEGFKSVISINRNENLGSFLSVRKAIDEILQKYRKIIFLEDDNIVSPNFLGFLNEGLAFYQNEKTIFSISAYNYPITIPASYHHNVYKWQGFSAWGVGLWLDRWEKMDWKLPKPDVIKQNKALKKKINLAGEHLYPLIKYSHNSGREIIDVIVSYYMCQQDLFSVFPITSKVRNMGHDGSGEHGGVTDRFRNQILDSGSEYSFVANLSPNKEINKQIRKYFRLSLKSKLISSLVTITPEFVKKSIKYFVGKRRD